MLKITELISLWDAEVLKILLDFYLLHNSLYFQTKDKVDEMVMYTYPSR